MDGENLKLIVKVSNGDKNFTMGNKKGIKIEDIKKRCKDEFFCSEDNLNNIILYCKDSEGDKILITENDDLIENASIIDDIKYKIHLYAEVIKIDEKKNNYINNNINKISDNNDNNKNQNDDKQNEKEENEELKKTIEMLKQKIIYYEERIKKINIYYKKIIDKLTKVNKRNKNLNLNNNDINNQYEENNHKMNGKFNETNELENPIEKNNNKINIIKEELTNEENKSLLKKRSYTQINDSSLKNNKKNNTNYDLKALEFVKDCNNCHTLNPRIIYKCVVCDNYFLCQVCYQTKKKIS